MQTRRCSVRRRRRRKDLTSQQLNGRKMTSVSKKQYFIHIVRVILCIRNQNLECAFNHKIHLKILVKVNGFQMQN